MVRGLHYAALLLVLAAQTGDASCEDMGTPGYSCHVSVGDLQVAADGHVISEVHNWCETGMGPESQTFMTWIETRRNPADDWLVASRVGIERRPPLLAGDTYKLRDGRCQADVEYGVAWRASGVDRNGLEFDTKTKREQFGRTDLC